MQCAVSSPVVDPFDPGLRGSYFQLHRRSEDGMGAVGRDPATPRFGFDSQIATTEKLEIAVGQAKVFGFGVIDYQAACVGGSFPATGPPEAVAVVGRKAARRRNLHLRSGRRLEGRDPAGRTTARLIAVVEAVVHDPWERARLALETYAFTIRRG